MSMLLAVATETFTEGAHPLPVLLPVVVLTFAVLAMLAAMYRPTWGKAVAGIGAIAGFALALLALFVAMGADEPIRHLFGGWDLQERGEQLNLDIPIGIHYVLDDLAAYMAVIIMGVGGLAVLFPDRPGLGFRPTAGTPVYTLQLVLLAGLLGVVLSGDLFHLFVFLEIYAIATYALIAMGNTRSVYASFRYLLIGTTGSAFYLIGVGCVYFSTGSLNMAELANELLPQLHHSPAIIGAAVLITVGLAIKMALFPLHIWLPEAHANAPPAVAALLAAVQVKVGAYALIRVLNGVFGTEFALHQLPLGHILLAFSATGILVGSILAVRQDDFKRLLAYSTVAQLGYIGVGIALGTPAALVGGLMHVLAHALAKSCLFFVAGCVYDQTHVRLTARYAGLGKRMPLLMAGMTIAMIGMIGIPPTLGFFSKFYLVLATIEAGHWFVGAVLVGASVLTAIYFLGVLEQVWLKEPVDEAVGTSREPTLPALLPVLILAVAVLVLGLGNYYLTDLLLSPLAERVIGP